MRSSLPTKNCLGSQVLVCLKKGGLLSGAPLAKRRHYVAGAASHRVILSLLSPNSDADGTLASPPSLLLSKEQ